MRALALLLLIAVPAAAPAAPVPKELRKNGLDKFVGSWVQDPANGSTWKFEADGTAAIHNGGAAPSGGIKYAIDSSADPMTLDWVASWGTWYGLCELKDDTFAIYLCRANGAAKIRPKALEAAAGVEIYRFKRAASAK